VRRFWIDACKRFERRQAFPGVPVVRQVEFTTMNSQFWFVASLPISRSLLSVVLAKLNVKFY